MFSTLIKTATTALALTVAAQPTLAAEPTAGSDLSGTWFVEVSGVLPDGGAYQNIMNISADGTADVVGGWMFGAGGLKFTDSPASVTKREGESFEIQMFAFLADAKTGVPNGLNVTVYRGDLNADGAGFSAEADLYYLPCSPASCPAPDLVSLGAPATVAQVTGTRLARPAK